MRVPGGGASCLGVGRPGSGAVPPPAARPLGGLPGPTTHWLWVRGGAGVGTRHQPHCARSCVLWGPHEGARGRRLLPGCGASGVGRSPDPDCPPSGRAAGAHYSLASGCGGVRAWGPVTKPTARALASWLCALWERHEGARGGGLLPGYGASGDGRSPTPDFRPLGGLPGPTTHWLWVRGGAGVGTRHRPHSARSCVLWGRHEGARGGRLLPGCGASGVGRSPIPDCPPSGRAAGAHYPLAVGAGGCGRGDPSPNPQRALLRAGFARCGSGTRAPVGGPSCLGVGRPGSGAHPPPTARPLGGLPGPTTHWLWVRGGAGVGTRHQPHSARSCALWGRHEGARGGRLLPGYGASGVGCSPIPNCAPREGGLAGPTTHWLRLGGGCGRGDPSPTPQRALLRAGFARCGGGMRAPGGGASCLGVGRPGFGALPSPTAGSLGGLPGPTTRRLWVRGGAGVGTRHQPHSARSCELALRDVGAARGCPGGGPPAWVWGVRGRALSHPRLPALWTGCRGSLPTGCGCGGVRAWGTRHRTHSARSCVLWGRHEGAPGGRLLPGYGASGVGRSPIPDCPPSGRAGGAHHRLAVGGGGVRAWGPVTNPTARALVSSLCALWGQHEGARGGRLLPWCGASGVGRAPTPDCPPSGRAARAHYPMAVGAGGCGRGDPSPTPQRPLLRAGFARCGGGMRVPGEGASCLGVGRPGSGALPTPTARPLGGLPGPTTHWLWVRGGAGVGTRHQPHSARSCVLWGRHEGARGGRLLPGCGASGVGRSPITDCPPSGRAAGAHYPLAVSAGGVRAWGPVTKPTARALASWLCALWERHEGARGGRLLPGCGASGVGRSPTPDCPPSGQAAGAHYRVAVGAGECMRGDPSPGPQRALLRAVGAA